MQQFNKSVSIAQTIFDRSSEAILILDAKMRIVKVNASFTTISGYQANEVIGRNLDCLRAVTDKPYLDETVLASLNETLYWEGELTSQRKSGEAYMQWQSITAIRDVCGELKNYIVIFSDITERKRTESYIRYLTDYDALTGLPNRFLLLRQLDELLPLVSRKNEMAALLFLDIDHFKIIINSLGHSIGDKVLLEISKTLSSAVYAHDIVARLGGDEFALVLVDLPADRNEAVETVKHICQKVRTKLSSPINMMGHYLVVSCSIGVVFFPTDADSSEQLFKLADVALQEAKQEGRDQIQFVTPDIARNANRRMILLSALNFALALNEFVLLLQPQFNQQKKLISAEALLRWQPNGQTMATPDEFIPLAEENGSIIAIGLWVLRTVCGQIKIWRDDGVMAADQSIAINISPKQFVQADFVTVITQIVAEFKIAPCNLELELTEGMLIKNVEESVNKLEALKQAGFRISIDDFGTGYSSLAYLKRFPLDTLKIDRSFVTEVNRDASNAGIVEAIIAMSKALKFDTVAEGVETQAEFDFLNNLDCDIYQGYFFSKPLTIEEFDLLLRASVAVEK